MKKILAFVAVAVTAVAMASADPLLVGHGYFGVGLGSTVADSEGKALGSPNNTGDYKWAFGSNLDFGAGIGVNIPFGGYFGIQPGVDFYVNNVGYSYDNETTILSTTTKTHTDKTYSYLSIDIPVLFTIKINKFNFAVGPYVSIPLGGQLTDADKTTTTTTVGSITNTSTDDHTGDNAIKRDHSWGSIGLSLGMGYEQRIGMGWLVIGGRYMLDFVPIQVQHKNSEGTPVTDFQFNRRALAVDVAYKIPLSF